MLRDKSHASCGVVPLVDSRPFALLFLVENLHLAAVALRTALAGSNPTFPRVR